MGQCPEEASRVVKQPGEENFNKIAMDYAFITQRLKDGGKADDEGDNKDDGHLARTVLTMFVVKDFAGEAILTYPVQAKGLLRDTWVAHPLMEDLETLGLNCQELSIRCDQESAVVEIQKELQKMRDAIGGRKTMLENSRIGDSDSNGNMEKGGW